MTIGFRELFVAGVCFDEGCFNRSSVSGEGVVLRESSDLGEVYDGIRKVLVTDGKLDANCFCCKTDRELHELCTDLVARIND